MGTARTSKRRESIVIGTAGHIDHGKTALVKLLTGIDTDRLKEEKERGISIDLGFAHLSLPSGVRAGIVDVPGHERFVRNMLAGAGGIDIVLFVIAADEGVMPQTVEHLSIVDLLRVHGGVIALTKSDLVEEGWVDMVSSDVRKAVAGTILETAPIVPISSVSGKGKDELLRALDEAVARLPERVHSPSVRLPIDRVFTVEGFGTVVTGTLWTGIVRVGDTLEVLPGGKKVRVRNIQVFGHDVTEIASGQRVALALHGVSRADLSRGDWLVSTGTVSPTAMLDVRLELLKDVAKALRSKARIRFHLGSTEAIGRVYFLDKEEISSGESSFAQLRLETSVVGNEGDRFVIRSYSPQVTIGGGTILVPHSTKHRKSDTSVVSTLELIERGSPVERVEHAIKISGENGVEFSELLKATAVEASEAEGLVSRLVEQGKVERIGDTFIHHEHSQNLKEEISRVLGEYQERYRLRWGMTKGELRNRFSRISGELFSALLDALQKEGKLFVKNDKLRSGSLDFNLSIEERRLRDDIENTLRQAGFNVPSFKELAKRSQEEKTLDILNLLIEERKVRKITSELFFHSSSIEEAEKRLKEFLLKKGTMQVTDFKDLINVTRKFAVPLLEYFDRCGITVRRGDARVLARQD